MDWSTCQSAEGVATLNCIFPLFESLISFAIAAAGIVAVFFIIWGGVKILRSGGDPKQMESARGTITYAIIGLILVFCSYFIIYLVSTVTGVDCIKVFGFSQCK